MGNDIQWVKPITNCMLLPYKYEGVVVEFAWHGYVGHLLPKMIFN